MGIYRTLLEEEVPHITEDDTNVDIKEIEDIVDDHDANEAEQQDAQDAAFGPDGGVDDIMDESAMAIWEFQVGQNQIMQTIGMHELNEAVNGREFIFEAADIKGFFASAKKKVIDFFKRIWNVLQKWAGNLAATIASNKKLVEKYADKIKSGAEKVDKNQSIKGYMFAALDGEVGDIKKKEARGIDKVTQPARDLSNATADNILDFDSGADEFDRQLKEIRGMLCGAESVDSSEFSAKLREHLFGSKEPEDLKLGGDKLKADKIIENLRDVHDDTKAVKEFMKTTKDQFNKVLNNLKTLEKAVNSGEDGVEKNKKMSACVRLNNFTTSCLTIMQTWRTGVLQAINARARQSRKVAMAYIRAENGATYSNKSQTPKSESYGFLGAYNLI